MLESRFQRLVINFLKNNGYVVYNEVRGESWPDIFVWKNKKHALIELKTNSSLKPHQALKIRNLNKKGVYSFCFKYGEDWKVELIKVLNNKKSHLVIDHNDILNKIKWD